MIPGFCSVNGRLKLIAIYIRRKQRVPEEFNISCLRPDPTATEIPAQLTGNIIKILILNKQVRFTVSFKNSNYFVYRIIIMVYGYPKNTASYAINNKVKIMELQIKHPNNHM